MKQDRIDRLIEITGQIPEAYVAEALPQSIREALPSDGLTEAPKEKRTMKQSITHYIAGGFAAAAALGVLVGTGVLISTLKHTPERPGHSGTDTTSLTAVTETTESAETTVSTDTTAAADDPAATVRIGDYEIAKHDSYAEVIGFSADAEQTEIPAEAEGLPVTRIGEGAFRNSTALINVTIPASVTSVGSQAFANCPKLGDVTFLNDNTEIADNAFAGCGSDRLALRGGAKIEAYARAHGFDYEPLDGTQPHTDTAVTGYQYYHFEDGKAAVYTWPEGYKPQIISDGTYYFSTKNNSLYRRDNNQLIMTVQNPQQYLKTDGAKGKQPLVDYQNIVAVGDKWYFVVAHIGYEGVNDWNGKANFTLETELLYWVNRQTGTAEICPAPTNDLYDVIEGTEGHDPRNYGHGDPDEKYEIGTALWQGDPDGTAVYATDYTEQLVIRMPVPGAGKNTAYYAKHQAGTLMTNFFTPIGNGKVLILANAQGQYLALNELNTADGSMKLLTDSYTGHDIHNVHGRILSAGWNTASGKEDLIEYFPATGKTAAVAALGSEYSMLIADVSRDAVIISAMWETNHYEDQPDLLVSLTDGKVTELKP